MAATANAIRQNTDTATHTCIHRYLHTPYIYLIRLRAFLQRRTRAQIDILTNKQRQIKLQALILASDYWIRHCCCYRQGEEQEATNHQICRPRRSTTATPSNKSLILIRCWTRLRCCIRVRLQITTGQYHISN